MKETRKGDPPPNANEASEATTTAGASLPRLIDLGADKCIPCKQMAPILEELSRTYGDVFEVEFVDVWKDPAAAKPWGLRVIPTQFLRQTCGVLVILGGAYLVYTAP